MAIDLTSNEPSLSLRVDCGDAYVRRLDVYELSSIWEDKKVATG